MRSKDLIFLYHIANFGVIFEKMNKDDQKKMKEWEKGDDTDLIIQKRVMSGINKGDGIGQMKQKLNDHDHANQDRLREYDTEIS